MTSLQPEFASSIDPPPHPKPAPPKRFVVPNGAVDTHAHVIGSTYIANRSYTPRPASAEDYLHMLDAVGMTYGVLVQVSVHGVDNQLMRDTVAAHSDRLRGIAVVEPDVSETTLAALKRAGVVGLRLNTTTGGGVGIANLERYAAICEELDWHLQFLVEPEQLADLIPKVAALRVPAVFDHMGYVHAGPGMSEARQALLQLVNEGAWVKLSGAFRLSRSGPPYADTVELVSQLAAVAPERCLWGSDWPHVKFRGAMPNPGDLLDLLAACVPDAALRQAILVDNPRRLYGFMEKLSRAGCDSL